MGIHERSWRLASHTTLQAFRAGGDVPGRRESPSIADVLNVLIALLLQNTAMVQATRNVWLSLRDHVSTVVQWQDREAIPDVDLIRLAFGVTGSKGVELAPFVSMAPPPLLGGELVVLLAYLDATELAEAKRAIIWAGLRVHAIEEAAHRLDRHPVGALLCAAAALHGFLEGSKWPLPVRAQLEAIEDVAAGEWLRRAAHTLSISVGSPLHRQRDTTWTRRPRRGTRGSAWLHGVLGEADDQTVREEAVGLLGQRLSEDVDRLSRLSVDELVGQAITGKLDYHRKSAEQAVVRGWRPERERHELADDPEEAAERERHRVRLEEEPVVGSHERAKRTPPRREEVEDPQRVAAAVIRAYRLPSAQARVVEYYVQHPGEHSWAEVAEGAGVSLETVKATLRRMKAEPKKLLELFPHIQLHTKPG